MCGNWPEQSGGGQGLGKAVVSLFLAASLSSSLTACASDRLSTSANLASASFVALDEGPGEEYVIGPLDALTVHVWRNEDLGAQVQVRPDGRIHGQGGCHVWGEVRDTRPFLAQADIVIAPLTVARGVQNKVLEAMAMAKPVLLSPGAATGIPVTDGRHFVIAESNHDFATCAIAMLNSASLCRSLGENARAFVTQHRSWQAMLAPLDQLLEPAFVYPSQGTDLADVPTGYGTSPSVLPLGCDAFGEGVEVRK